MKRTTLMVALSLVGTASMMPAQYTVYLSEPVRARSLSGIVADATGAPVANANIQLLTCPIAKGYGFPAPKIVAETSADSTGRFKFDQKGHPEPYCMRVSSPGFNPVEFQIKLSPFAGILKVQLPVAA
jgi:hypothetical protein